VASYGLLVNQRKTSFLDYSSGRYAVSNQFNYKKATMSIELWEFEALSMAEVAGLV